MNHAVEKNGMTDAELRSDNEISLLALGTTLLRNRWRLVRWMLIGAVLAVVPVLTKPLLYRAAASFIPQGADAPHSGLASLAGQFGVSLPAGNASLSPEFYAKLLQLRVLLIPIVHDTFTVKELGGKRITFVDLFGIRGPTMERREELAVTQLRGMVTVSPGRTSGVIEFSVTTKWRSISLAIATSLVKGLDDYNERMRQGQATAERTFVEGRVALASAELRAAEDRLERFQRANRDIGSSAELMLQRERIQRDIALRQQVFTTLMQSYEEARIREVRDVPVITMFEAPWVPTQPEPRGRLRRVLFGLILGAFIGALLAFASEMMARGRANGSHEAGEFFVLMNQIKAEMLRPVQRLRRVVKS